jgi:hypothetical protein
MLPSSLVQKPSSVPPFFTARLSFGYKNNPPVHCILWYRQNSMIQRCHDKQQSLEPNISLFNSTGQVHASAVLYPREKTPGTHWIGGWVGIRAGLNTEARGKILCLCQGSNLGCPVCKQILHWLSYPSCYFYHIMLKKHCMIHVVMCLLSLLDWSI